MTGRVLPAQCADLSLPLRFGPGRVAVFSVVVGLIHHQLLQVHHVRDDLGGPWTWCAGFLAFGLLLIVGAFALHRQGGGKPAALPQH